MSYQTAGGGGPQVTYLEDLPDLDFHDSVGPQPYQNATRDQMRASRYPGADHLPPDQAEKFQKYIRGGTREMPPESGMSGMMAEQQMKPAMEEMQAEHVPMQAMPVQSSNGPSCLDVADHIENCPICSKLYKDDKTVYLIAIVVLAIICIILLKKVLDV